MVQEHSKTVSTPVNPSIIARHSTMHPTANDDNIDAQTLHLGLILTIAIALFADFFLLSVVIPILPDFLSSEYDTTQIGLLFASKPIAQLLGNFFAGWLINTNGPRVVLLISTFILTISTAAFGYPFLYLEEQLTEAYVFLIIARSVQGIASSAIMSAGMAIIAATHVESIHGTAMGMAMAGVAAGALLGPVAGSLLVTYFDNSTPFFLVTGILIVDLVSQCFVLCDWCSSRFSEYTKLKEEQVGRENEERPVSMCALLSDSRVLVLELGNFLGVFTIGMMEVLIPLFLSSQYDFKPLRQGLIFSTMSLAYLIATPISGILSDKVPKWKIFGGGALLVSCGLTMFYGSDKLWLLFIALAVSGAGVAAVDTVALSILSIVACERSYALGSIYALHDCSTSMGFASGPLVASALVEALGGMPTGFANTAVVCAIVMFLYSFATLHLSSVIIPDTDMQENLLKEASKELTTTDGGQQAFDNEHDSNVTSIDGLSLEPPSSLGGSSLLTNNPNHASASFTGNNYQGTPVKKSPTINGLEDGGDVVIHSMSFQEQGSNGSL